MRSFPRVLGATPSTLGVAITPDPPHPAEQSVLVTQAPGGDVLLDRQFAHAIEPRAEGAEWILLRDGADGRPMLRLVVVKALPGPS